LDKEHLRSWLALLRLPGIGPVTLQSLLTGDRCAHELLNNPPAGIPERLRQRLKQPDWLAADQDMQWLSQPGNHFLPITDPRYPAQLKTIADPPSALFVHGDLSILSTPQIAMVGSRNPSTGGARTAHDFALHFAATGLTITSGLAMGIDAASHQGALAAEGTSIAVTGTGLDRVYPASNRELAHQIANHGALISEFPPGTPPRPGHFPRRNRIIAGLSLGTLVVEAALKSGSLITAQQALEQSREVFAIPGSIHNPLARGCHLLIRQGAKLVETANDVLEELAPALSEILMSETLHITGGKPAASPLLDDDYQQLLDAMGFDPISTDSIIERTGMAPEAVSSMLLLLEMDGHVSSEPGGLFARTQKPTCSTQAI